MSKPNYRLVATQVGDVLKWNVSLNEIDRVATALFPFSKENFPNEAITSSRAHSIYDWILSLARQNMENSTRADLLAQFCRQIAPSELLSKVDDILREQNVVSGSTDSSVFDTRSFHSEVYRHSRILFSQGHYFHAVFESAKAYNKLVREKAKSLKDGQSLMLEVWGHEKGVLKVTACVTETDRNVQDGIKFLSAGLMQAIRNPTSHEPALDWPISKHDALDILSFISFLFRQLDKATYFKAG